MNPLRAALTFAILLAPVASASVITYQAPLAGSIEIPPTGSPATGFATVIIDTVANSMFVSASFSGLVAGTTASHVHCCTTVPGTGNAGVATQVPAFLNMPIGVTSGSFTQTLDLTLASTYNPAFVTANGGSVASTEAVFLAGLAADETYFNIHTTTFPNGEIRGFLVATPEPATLLMAGLAFLGLAVRYRSHSRIQ